MENETHTAPACIGFIMDGNRRFAKERGFPAFEGHRQGYEKLKEVLSWTKEAGIENAIVYALSTENWQRSESEIGYLLDLFRTMLRDEIDAIAKEDVRIIFAGDLSRFPEDVRQMMRDAMEKTKHKQPYTLVVAASYGGRAEIVHAVNELLSEGVDSIDEQEFAKHLWTRNVPDPDLIIRTGGEMRLSNFLPWQSTYSELFFVDTHWPALSKGEFLGILEAFSRRTRRHGA